jgi:hypothetical protein
MKRHKNLIAVLLLTFFFVSLDRFFFDWLLWQIPNESAWSSNFFHGYEYQYRDIQKRWRNSSLKKILIIGSSIAAYSLQPDLVRNELNSKFNMDADVEILSFAGMTPLDVYMLKEKISLLKPDLVVYPVNFIDFRIHRNYQIHPDGASSVTKDWEFLQQDALHYGNAPQSRIFYPCETISEFFSILSWEVLAEHLSACLATSYRYRDVYYENLKYFYNHRFGRNTSYHGYIGVQIPERISFLGWTGKTFSFEIQKYMKEEGFYIQVVPEILEKKPLEIQFYENGSLVQKEIFDSPGWKKIVINSKLPISNHVTAQLSNTWTPYQAKEDRFDYSLDEMGVRLQQNFGRKVPDRNYQVYREERKEDLRFESQTDESYNAYFHFRLLDFLEKRPGIQYFHSIRNAKILLSREPFFRTTQLHYLEKAVNAYSSSGMRVLLINNPENPLTLQLYKNSDWYKGYLHFLQSISSNAVHYLDWNSMLKAQDFSDFHHFTYPAMERMNPIYSKEIYLLLNQK